MSEAVSAPAALAPSFPAPHSPWRMSVAPMMDWTDKHCRYLHRLLSRHALLYTEMVNCGAIVHGDAERHLRFNLLFLVSESGLLLKVLLENFHPLINTVK